MKKIILILMLCATCANATDYWVAKTGDNGNSGADSANAWATIAYAFTQIANTDTIQVCGGWYNESDISMTSAVGFYMFGRGNVTWAGGVICSTWSAAASPAYYSDEVTNVNTSGVYFDTTIQLAVATDSANCVATDSSYYFAANRLFVNLPSGVNPASHRIEVSTESGNYLMYASYANLDGEKLYFRNITFSLSEGTALSFSGSAAVAPDSLIFDSCVFRNNSGGTTGLGTVGRINFNDGGTPSVVKHLQFNDCYLWANYKSGAGDGLFNIDYPGTVAFNRCYIAHNTVTNGADLFDIRDYAESDITYTANFLNCILYRNYTTSESHALISMSCDYNKFDSCLFIRNNNSVDGGVTFQECDSSHVSYCAFVADTSNGDGAQGSTSATISSVHPGDGHILYVGYNRIIDCYSSTADDGSVGPYLYRGVDGSDQTLYFIGNVITGATQGTGIKLQDADMITMGSQSGNSFYNITDINWDWGHDATTGNNVSPYVAVYDTTADDTVSIPSTTYEDSVLVLLNGMGNQFMDMADHWDTYWSLRADPTVPTRYTRKVYLRKGKF